ncbi:MAG: CPBP family intramembrane glutamic endopeptidase [Spirochaetales bacterium]
MKNKQLRNYLITTFSITWISWWLLATLTSNNILPFTHPIATIIFTIGGFGPTVAALAVLPKKLTRNSVCEFIFSYRKNTIGYLFLFSALWILVVGISSLETNPALPWFALPIVLAMTTFIGGGNEELGWRGIMQPILESKLPFFSATLITGCVWAVWHLPLWFIVGSTQSTMSFVAFSVLAVLLSFWLAALYKKTKSVFVCCVFHGLSNLLLSFFIIKINWILIVGLLSVTVLAVLVWNNTKTKST